MVKNANIEKKKYSGYGIGFVKGSAYLLPDGSFGRNVVIFGADLWTHLFMLIIKEKTGKGPAEGLDEHSLTAEKMDSVNFTDHRKKCCLSLHSGANSYLFANGTEIIKFKAKDSNIIATPLCLRNISKGWSVDNMKDTGLNWYVY